MIDSSKTGGRRTQAHEFADVDVAYVEDSGQRPNRYQIRGFLVGDDYNVKLQRLEEQLELGGDIELDHPHRGKILGLRIEGDYTSNEGRDTLGFAEISFTLVQNGLPSPMIFESKPGAVKLAAERVYLAAQEEMEERMSALDVVQTITKGLSRVTRGMNTVQGSLLSKLGTISPITSQINQFSSSVQTLAATPKTIATSFRGIARSLMGAVSGLAKVLGRAASGYANPADTMVDHMVVLVESNYTPEALADYAYATATPPGEELAGEALIAKIDVDVLNVFVAATTVAALAEFATEIQLPTADAADAFADAIVNVIDGVLGSDVGDGPISENLYTTMLAFKAKTVAYLTAVAEQLPSVTVITVQGEASAVLIAFWESGVGGEQLDGFVESIIAANALEDPLSIPDGTEIKVVIS